MLSKQDEEYIESKIKDNPDEIRFTFFEIRVKLNKTEQEAKLLLNIAQNKLENSGYRCYFEDEKFEFKNAYRRVQPNELMIAVKI